MADIFISYSRKDQETALALRTALEARGYSVWMDVDLESRSSFIDQTNNALKLARVVLVIWTLDAQLSRWVNAEALKGFDEDKLVSVIPDSLRPEDLDAPFNDYQCWPAGDLDAVMADVDRVLAGQPGETRRSMREIYETLAGEPLLDPKYRDLPRDPDRIRPSMLLQAVHRVVPYHDVTGMLKATLDWCRTSPKPVAGRLLFGAGGAGKTRMMIEAAERLRGEGWAAGFLTVPTGPDAARLISLQRKACRQLIRTSGDAGVLLVFDYAEGRREDLRDWGLWLRGLNGTVRTPVRLVLLSRGRDWWDGFAPECPELESLFIAPGGQDQDVFEVARVLGHADIATLFHAALAAFAPILERKGRLADNLPSLQEITPPSSSELGDRPLTLELTALLHLTGGAARGTGNLLKDAWALELDHWRKTIGERTDEELDELQRGLAQITLIGSVPSREQFEHLILADPFNPHTARGQVRPRTRALTTLYGDDHGHIPPLEPDLLGEYLCADQVDKDLIEACFTWIETQPEEERSVHVLRLLTVLQRATREEHDTRNRQAAETALTHIVRTRLADWAEEIAAVLIETPGALKHIVETAKPNDVALNLLAEAFNNLGARLSSLGRPEEALAATQEAVERYRALAADRPDAFMPDLAGSLDNLGIMLSALGRQIEALAATKEAVERYRALAADRPDAFMPDLAGSLDNLGIMLSALGRQIEALAATQEAVEIRRVLAADRPDAFMPDLARSLNNLGVWLWSLGQLEEALAATQEAVEIRRALAADRPDAFNPDLASSLNNLGIRLSALGRLEEALAATQEAVKFLRALAAERPDAFMPDLAGSLDNLGIMLSPLGRQTEALAATQEAVEIRRALAADRPDAFNPDLARSLNNLGIRLSSLGRREEALAATQEAVDLYRALAAARPDAFNPDLAGSLDNLGIMLSALGRLEEALAATQEAVEIRRALAAARPEAFNPDLARSLNNLGNRLSALGRLEEALTATQGAVDLYRALAAARPEAFTPDLATSLNNLGYMLSGLGRLEEAVEAAHECLTLIAPFLERRPDAHRTDVTVWLKNYLSHCKAAGIDPDHALVARIETALETPSDTQG